MKACHMHVILIQVDVPAKFNGRMKKRVPKLKSLSEYRSWRKLKMYTNSTDWKTLVNVLDFSKSITLAAQYYEIASKSLDIDK